MLYPSRRLNSSLFFSSHFAILVISTSTTVVACGDVRLLRTMCSAIARRMRLGVTISTSPSTAVVEGVNSIAGAAKAGCGSGAGPGAAGTGGGVTVVVGRGDATAA